MLEELPAPLGLAREDVARRLSDAYLSQKAAETDGHLGNVS